MPHYHHLGEFPPKRHTQFRKPDGGLYAEQLISTEGFSDIYSLAYHIDAPTAIVRIEEPWSVAPEIVIHQNIHPRSLQGFQISPEMHYLDSRKVLMANDDCQISVAAPQTSMTDLFFKNAMADEVLFIHEGTGVCKTPYGCLRFGYGDYIVIPRGTIYQLHFDTPQNRLLVIESMGPVRFPKKYRNAFGQLEPHAPFYERDIRKPKDLETHAEIGEFRVMIQKQGMIFPVVYQHHPFNWIGWDGYLYPYILSIHDFEPITGRVHQPPPVHQTFDAHRFVICSFVPRLFDYHPNSIPAPYNHSNVDSDEVLYYVDGDFMSRKHVTQGMFTLHPTGIPHGPHPGTVEKSIGKKETLELAVMIDTFRPLKLTRQALEIEDADYHLSWLHP